MDGFPVEGGSPVEGFPVEGFPVEGFPVQSARARRARGFSPQMGLALTRV